MTAALAPAKDANPEIPASVLISVFIPASVVKFAFCAATVDILFVGDI